MLMHQPPTFALENIQQQLRQLDIPFSTHGKTTDDRYSFKSLRQIEPAGIYFLVSGIMNPPRIEGSIVLYPETSYGGEENITIQVEDPQLVFYRLMEALVGEKQKPKGIHPTAIVGEGCNVDPAPISALFAFSKIATSRLMPSFIPM